MKKFKNNFCNYIISNRLFLSYLILSIIGTFLVRKYTFGRVANILPLLTDLGIILILGAIGYFIKPKNQFKYFFSCLCVFTLTEIVNSVYYVFYTNFASFGDLATLSQAETVTGSIWEKMKFIYIVYLFFPVILYVIHNELTKSYYYNILDKVENSFGKFLKTFIVGFICLGISFAMASKTDYSRLAKQWNRIYIVERFGVLVYQGNDLIQTLRPKISSLFGYDEALQQFNEYFESDAAKKYREENKYTGN